MAGLIYRWRTQYTRYGHEVTSHDVIKSYALIWMIIDHIGVYLFPDDMGFRAIGRASAPLWLFLIGYAYSQRRTYDMVIAAILVTAINLWTHYPLFPLNVLWTMVICRYVFAYVQPKPETIYVWIGVVMIAWFMSFPFIEYASIGLCVACLGMLSKKEWPLGQRVLWFCVGYGLYMVHTMLSFSFSLQQWLVVAIMVSVSFGLMVTHTSKTYGSYGALGAAIRFVSRNSLDIYVFHIVLLIAIQYALSRQLDATWKWFW